MGIRARHARRTRAWGATGAALLAAGVAAIVVAACAQQSAPQPSASAAIPAVVTPSATSPQTSAPTTDPPATTMQTSQDSAATTRSASLVSSPKPASSAPAPSTSSKPASAPLTAIGPVLKRSLPTHLSIPAIGVDSSLKDIGLTSDGHIVTPPLDKDSHPYWLDVSPTPGQFGPSVILGHVDSAKWGPAIFFDLGKLRQHDTIDVTLADHTVAVFEVTHVNEYKKAEFPTGAVYGNTDHAALRLMTCGGIFNEAERSYESNIVVYAQLVDSHRT